MKTVLIYKTELLPMSETFIQAQAGALRKYRPRFAGLQRAPRSLPLPDDTILAVNGRHSISRAKLHLYRLSGIAPHFLKQIRDTAAVLIHSHFATESVTALPVAKTLKAPLIVTLHGADITVTDSMLKRTLGGRVYLRRKVELWRRTSVFICVSEFIKRKALEAGFPEHKLRVHYIGIDRSRFLPSTKERNPESIVFVGRLTEKKGCRYLLQAMALVQRERPSAELTIIGAGHLRSSLEAQARELQVRCTFLGEQPADAVRAALDSARVFCVPSVTAQDGDSEGLGMVFAESQAMGVPVVSFRHGGIPEVVRDGETGLLAPEANYVQLAENLLTYLKDERFWRESSERGKNWIQQRFDIATQTAELEGIYDQVVQDFARR